MPLAGHHCVTLSHRCPAVACKAARIAPVRIRFACCSSICMLLVMVMVRACLQGKGSLLAVAVSDDGRMLAVGGGDRVVHVWDARSRQYIQVQLGRMCGQARMCLAAVHVNPADVCWCSLPA